VDKQEYFAVLTGDIIQSRFLSEADLDRVRDCLLSSVDAVRAWKRGLVEGEAEFFRGDAWQMLLNRPALAMRVAVFLRASLLAEGKADSRISIGLGRAENLSKHRVALSTGEAFVLSGNALDRMTRNSRMAVEVTKSIWPLSEWLPIVAQLCDALINQWTGRQAEIIRIAAIPTGPTHEEIAQKLNPAISKQAVAKALRGANWHAIREAIHQFEETEWESVLQAKEG